MAFLVIHAIYQMRYFEGIRDKLEDEVEYMHQMSVGI